jgi:hypothetical protein
VHTTAPLIILALLGGNSPTPVAFPVPFADTIPRRPIPASEIELVGPVRPGEYLGVVAPRAAWLGRETGEAEIWVHPLKVAREFILSFKVPEYRDPIPGSSIARTVRVRPEGATIVYSHASFSVRQHVMVPRDQPGLLVLLEVDSARPLEVIVEFQPILQLAWPGGFGGQFLGWSEQRKAFILSESLRKRNALIGSPWAAEATAHPAHRLADAPATFVIPVDPDRAGREMIPIVIAGSTAGRDSATAAYDRILSDAAAIPGRLHAWAETTLDRMVQIDTPDDSLDLAFTWTAVNLEEQRVCNPDLGCGFVAGWGPSGSSLRPGFGWFFGGDAMMTSTAMVVAGQTDLVAEELKFLARYQREDGKMPHEISQAAASIPWFDEYPYPYYHADTTPWWMVAVWQYWRTTGDDQFVRDIWPAYQKAWSWFQANESDGDGLLENTTAGLAAVEVGELGAGLHQGIYLAAVGTAALEGTAQLAGAIGDASIASEAERLGKRARQAIDESYWLPEDGHHAFALLRDGGKSRDLTAWAAVGAMFGLFAPDRAEGTLQKLAAGDLATDWGARMLSSSSPLYDPLHYNSGTVWPFVTSFVGLGQYRYRRPWSGYPFVDAMRRLTFDWALGRHPELLSGRFYNPLDETVPHQFFASSALPAMFIRGTLGWDPDASAVRARLSPQLPPQWERVEIRNLAVGSESLDVKLERGAGSARLEVAGSGSVELEWTCAIPAGARNVRAMLNGTLIQVTAVEGTHDGMAMIVLPPGESARVAEVTWDGGLEVVSPLAAPQPGEESRGMRVLDFGASEDGWRLRLEGPAGSEAEIGLIGEPVRVASVEGLTPSGTGNTGAATVEDRDPGTGRTTLSVRFPDGYGWSRLEILLAQGT